jgi:hypothetical protein
MVSEIEAALKWKSNKFCENSAGEETMIPKPVEVRALDGFRIWLRYEDGTEGEIDLSDIAGHGVFAAWNDPALFRSVRLGSHGAIEWGDDLDICPDAMYLRLTGKSPEDMFPALRSMHLNA